VLLAPPEVIVDLDSVTHGHGTVHQRARRDSDAPVRLIINVTGHVRHGNFVVRGPRRPRRSFWAWLLRRQPTALAVRPGQRALE
jgi:hypothetical protein